MRSRARTDLRGGTGATRFPTATLRAGDTDTPRAAPGHTAVVDRLAGRLAEWGRARDATDKLIWLLDHDYSEAGLSFDALKNADAAVAAVLARAAERAACDLSAAVVRIEEYGVAEYAGSVGGWGWDDTDDDDGDWEMGDVDERREWLDGWVQSDGRRPAFGEVELQPGELLPRGALDDAEPDEQRVHEASGNEGVSIERTYRRAALVLWPRSKALAIVARAGIDGAVAWVAEELERHGGVADERIRALVSRLIDVWPTDRHAEEAEGRVRMLRLLCAIGDEERAARFLREVVLARYDGVENEALAVVVDMIGPSAARSFLLDLTAAHLRRRPTDTLALLRCLDETRDDSTDSGWDDALREVVRAVLQTVPAALPPVRERHTLGPSVQRRAALSDEAVYDVPEGQGAGLGAGKRPARFGDEAIHDLFALAWRRGLADEAAAAAGAVVAQPRVVAPDRTLPASLGRLHAEEGAAGSDAFVLLWRHAADFLVTRSGSPPEEPRHWTIGANVGCRCEHCTRLRDFCKDPVARIARFPLRKDLRAHLHQVIDRRGLDIDHVTERRGRPFTLVCTKTRATYRRRLAEYAEDVSCMEGLIRAAPAGEQVVRCAPDLARLREAVAASEPEPGRPE